MKKKIMIIDDEEFICSSLTYNLEKEYEVFSDVNPFKALKKIFKEDIKIVLLDLKIGNTDGLKILEKIKIINNDITVIIMTAYGSIDSSVEAMKQGAFTYLTKPLNMEELKINIKQALKIQELNKKVEILSEQLKNKDLYLGVMGKTKAMQDILNIIEKIKNNDIGVLITGESGTGKGIIAKNIHSLSNRSKEKFVEVNCAAIPEGLLEDEFFGHRKGSFTNAIENKEGKLKYADKGTLFLDEIGDMSLNLQSKLLKVLEEKKFTPIGCNDSIDIDIRIIFATNKNLKKLVKEGKFRKDLYFRINLIEINLPTLKERQMDLPIFFKYFIDKYNNEMNKNIKGLSKEVENILLNYDYPGNIRELSNIIEYSMLLSSENIIKKNSLPLLIKNETKIDSTKLDEVDNITLNHKLIDYGIEELSKLTLKESEKILIIHCLKRNNGRKNITSKSLGLSEKGLRNKLKTYKIKQ